MIGFGSVHRGAGLRAHTVTWCVAVALLLAACAPAAPPATKPSDAAKPAAPAAQPAATTVAKPAEAAKPVAAPIALRWWSHWADADNNKAVLNEAVSRFEKANPGSKVEITWYQKNELNQALRGNFQAGQGPDVFYFDTDALEFIEGGFLADLSGGIRWDNVHPWAKEFWTRAGPGGKQGAWALPLEATTEEPYHNKQTFSELGITVPPSLRFDEA